MKNLLALFLGITVSFFIMEGILRIYNPFDFRIKGDKIILPANKKYVIKGDSLGDPSKKLKGKFDETIIHIKNSLGFRGEEPPADPSAYLKIITVGGSTTECTFLSEGKTWTDQLGNKLKKDFKKVWINNAGLDGNSTFGHIILMEDYIVKLKPNIVMFLIGINDQGLSDYGEQDREIIRNEFVFNSLKGFMKSLANHSEIFSLGLNLYRYWKAKSIGVEHGELDFEWYRNFDTESQYIQGKKIFETYKKSLNTTRNLKAFQERLKRLINISRGHNIEPILITQPALYGNIIDDVTGVNLKFTSHVWDALELYNEVTRKVGNEEDVIVIDLAHKMPKSSRYYYDWLHYTNEGAEKVAEIIYERLHHYLKNEDMGADKRMRS